MHRIHLFLAMGFFSFLFGSSSKAAAQDQPRPRPEQPAEDKKFKPEDMGRELRHLALTRSPEEMGCAPSKDFPRVYSILMDFPIDDEFATVVSTSEGAASLYTTGTFGIIGGQEHATVRAAAKKFVQAAEKVFDEAKPASEYPYPASNRLRFYLLTYSGVRVIDTDMDSIESETSKHLALFYLGQEVLTELRRVSGDQE